MAKEDKYSIRDLKQEFPNDDVCLEYIFDTLHSRKCSCGGTYKRIKGRLQFQCSKCRFQIAPMVWTIFEKSSTPLTLWFHALFIFSNAKSGISAKEMERQLGVTYKCAWRILTLIRKSLTQNNRKLKGTVEMDETYFGGHHNAGKNNEMLSVAMSQKSVIAGAVERQGEVKADVTPDATSWTLKKFLNEHVEAGTRLMTDESNRYNNITKNYKREMVNHKRKEYVRGDVYTNTIESFWSHVKRSITGTHKSVSKKYLQSYVDGFVFHWNRRRNDKARFSSLLGTLLIDQG